MTGCRSLRNERKKSASKADFYLQSREKLVLSSGEWFDHSLPEMAVSPEGGVQNEEV
jgi:hypothetical protein